MIKLLFVICLLFYIFQIKIKILVPIGNLLVTFKGLNESRGRMEKKEGDDGMEYENNSNEAMIEELVCTFILRKRGREGGNKREER